MKHAVVVAVLAVLALVPAAAVAQSSEELQSLRREIEALKAGQSAIQRELQEIKRLLQQRPPAAAAPSPPAVANLDAIDLTIDGAHVKGSPQARLTIVEFSDYQCPFCARHAQQTMAQIEREFIDTGKVRYAVRNLPLESIHPHAFKAAEAAECAGTQGKFWEMHKVLFANQRALGVDELPRHADTLGLDAAAFRRCLDSGQHTAKVRKDVETAQKAGLTGTPAFFIGVTRGTDPKVRVLRKITGAQPFPAFKAAVEALLAAADPPGK